MNETDRKNTFKRLFYAAGLLCGQFHLLAKAIKTTSKQYAEMGKWLKKAKKKRRAK